MHINEIIAAEKSKLIKMLTPMELALGEIVFNNGQCQLLTQSVTRFELIVSDESNNEVAEYCLNVDEKGRIVPLRGKEAVGWDRYSVACLLQVDNEMQLLHPREHVEHKKYTRQGMIKRVLAERRQKSEKAEYRIRWADNIFGDHILTNEKGIKYKVFLRDFENETGYSDSMDARLNKLGTTKHIMFAFRKLKEDKSLYNRLSKMQFLSGLFKMATGKEIGMENQKIEVNKETGEVTMKFKLPM